MPLFLLMCFGLSTSAAQTGVHRMGIDDSGQSATPPKGAHTNSQPAVIGARIYLFAVGMGGPNTAATSLLHGSGVTIDSDQNGYILTDSGGGFDLTGLYSGWCPTNDPLVYLVAKGGSTSTGQNNVFIDEVALLPDTCSQLSTDSRGGVLPIIIDERTTVAAAFSISPFVNTMDDGISISSGAGPSITEAFTFANSLISSWGGTVQVSGTTLNDLNTVSDVLGACVNTNGGVQCTRLMTFTTQSGQVASTNTWEAAVRMAEYPTYQVQNLYFLIAPVPPFAPTYSSLPSPATWALPSSSFPHISAISPSQAAVGDNLVLTGTNFDPILANNVVGIGGSVAPLVSISQTQGTVNGVTTTIYTLTVQVPSDAATGIVQLYVGNQGSNITPFALQAATHTTISLNPSTSVYQDPAGVTVTATVSTGTAAIPTGTVVCQAPGAQNNSANLTNGTAQVPLYNISVGTQTVRCDYTGSTKFAISNGTATEIVTLPSSTSAISLTSDGSPTSFGDIVTFTATVSTTGGGGAAPTGFVTFKDGAVVLATAPLTTTPTKYSTAILTVGTHAITAVYSGDGTFPSSTSTVFSQVVTAGVAGCVQ